MFDEAFVRNLALTSLRLGVCHLREPASPTSHERPLTPSASCSPAATSTTARASSRSWTLSASTGSGPADPSPVRACHRRQGLQLPQYPRLPAPTRIAHTIPKRTDQQNNRHNRGPRGGRPDREPRRLPAGLEYARLAYSPDAGSRPPPFRWCRASGSRSLDAGEYRDARPVPACLGLRGRRPARTLTRPGAVAQRFRFGPRCSRRPDHSSAAVWIGHGRKWRRLPTRVLMD